MLNSELPPRRVMERAMLAADAEFDGVFFTAVKTTGIFCRPSCGARKPRPENVEYFPVARDALFAGYRPCRRCHPLTPPGAPPTWLRPLLRAVEEDPARRWTDEDLRVLGLDPTRVRRWFKRHHGMTFHAYQRGRRLGEALGALRDGESVLDTAYEHGFESVSGFNAAFTRLFGGCTPGQATQGLRIRVARLDTPLGPMICCATDEAVALLEFADRRALEAQMKSISRRLCAWFAPGTNDIMAAFDGELQRYFEVGLERFETPLILSGTELQRQVWEELRTIPPGETRSYGEVARAVGRPRSARAMGRIIGANPIALAVPCHRIVGNDGNLTGYGGGLWRKKRLLEHERSFAARPAPSHPTRPRSRGVLR